jgi:hypothetical protein
MGIGKKKLNEVLGETLSRKQDRPMEQPALLGAYINGQKTIAVSGRPDFVWCRIAGNTSQQVRAFNQHAGGVGHHFDLPIIIIRDSVNPDVWKVAGRDIRKYGDWGASGNQPYSSPYLPPHGNDHSFSSQSGMGIDPVWVFKRQLMPMLPHPHPTGSMSIDIGSDFYYFEGTYRWFASTGTASLASHLPTGAANGRFVTVYIDGNTGNPSYLDGPEFNALVPPIDPGEFIAVPSGNQGVPVAAVFLLTGSSRIGWGEIFDLRYPHVPVPTGPGATRFAVGVPVSLGSGPTGMFWRVPDSQYYTGSLALSLAGLVLTPGVDYDEQHPGSGTFEFLGSGPPTGSPQVVWYGVEV